MDTKRKEQLQRTLVFLGLGLLFTLSILFIFKPSADEQSAAEQGLNKDVPQASPDELPTSKLKAYELGRDEEAEGRKSQLLGTLADYFNREGEAKAEPEPSEEVPTAIGRSIDKYEETTRELESFYDLPAVEDDDVKRELNALRAELGALKEEKAKANGEVDQLELLEKSYQMAAKYLPSGNATPNQSANSSDKSVKPPASELPAAELSPERETVVSSLDQPISDSAFIAEYGYKERNMGFRSVGKATPSRRRPPSCPPHRSPQTPMAMKRALLLLIGMVATALTAHAQRLLPRQTGVEITAGVPVIQNEKLIQPETFTANISFTRYLKAENYTFFSALYERQNLPYGMSNVPLSDALVLAGYMHPLLSDGGKNAFVYAGCSALAGYEELNRGESVLPDGAELLDRSRIVGGGGVHLAVELFLSDHLLFVVGSRGLFLFGSNVYPFRPAISAGFRINL